MERLQKAMAEAGVASRRASEKIILAGRVQVNGTVVRELGTKVETGDEILVDGVPIQREQHHYYLLNKPRGVISSAHDDKGRKTVVDILKDAGVEDRIYPVGRLDYDTTGIMVLTNDGALANRLMHPKFEVEKTYIAKVKGVVKNDDMRKLRRGIMIDGRKTKGAKCKLIEVSDDHQSSRVRLTIHEGHYHQVKRMLKAVGHPVMKLHREVYDGLTLAGIPNAGQWRELKPQEIQHLKDWH